MRYTSTVYKEMVFEREMVDVKWDFAYSFSRLRPVCLFCFVYALSTHQKETKNSRRFFYFFFRTKTRKTLD